MAGHDHTPALHGHADAWHHHESAEGKPQHEHAAIADAGALARWFVYIMVMLVVVILALAMYFYKYTTALRAERVETIESSTIANKERDRAEAMLGTDGHPISQYKYGVDTGTHKVQLPITQAMERVVASYQIRTSTPPSAPAANPASAPASTPAPKPAPAPTK